MQNAIRRTCIWAVCCTPLGALAQSTTGSTLPAGLDKPKTLLTGVQSLLLGCSVVLLTIALIATGIAMMYYKKRWEDISMPVIGGIVVGCAPAIASFLIN